MARVGQPSMTDRDRSRSRDRAINAVPAISATSSERGTAVVVHRIQVEVRGVREPGPFTDSERACTSALTGLQGALYTRLLAKDLSQERIAEITQRLNAFRQELETRR